MNIHRTYCDDIIDFRGGHNIVEFIVNIVQTLTNINVCTIQMFIIEYFVGFIMGVVRG